MTPIIICRSNTHQSTYNWTRSNVQHVTEDMLLLFFFLCLTHSLFISLSSAIHTKLLCKGVLIQRLLQHGRRWMEALIDTLLKDNFLQRRLFFHMVMICKCRHEQGRDHIFWCVFVVASPHPKYKRKMFRLQLKKTIQYLVNVVL